MKRVRIAPGKFVVISTELAEKAARVFGTGLTRDQVRDLKATETEGVPGLMVGSPKRLALRGRAWVLVQERLRAGARDSASSGPRRKTG